MEKQNQNIKDKIFLVLKVIIAGLFSGFVGMVAFAALTPPTDLTGDILKALIAGFCTMLIAIIIVIYLHNRQNDKIGDGREAN